MGSFTDENLIADFITECREYLDAIEPDLLSMEEQGADVSQETINSVFRAMHSMKGGSGFFALNNIKELSHSMESVLMLVREGKLSVGSELVDVLFLGVDKLRAMIDDVGESENISIDSEVTSLNAFLGEKEKSATSKVSLEAKSSTAGSLPKHFQISKLEIEDATRHGKRLFLLDVDIVEDLHANNLTPLEFLQNLQSVGDVLDSFFDIDIQASLEDEKPLTPVLNVLFATVLEEELVSMALELPEERVQRLDVSSIGEQEPKKVDEEVESAKVETDQEEAELATEIAESAPASEEVRKTAVSSETLRVKVDLLNRLMNSAGELVLVRNQLLRIMDGNEGMVPGLPAILQDFDQVTYQLQEGIMQTRMQPVGAVFSKFSRIVRDMSRKLNKEIAINIEGSEVELDKSIVESLNDPLTHLIRNSVDHGIEMPEDRKAAGKDAKGTINLKAHHESGLVNIVIKDDGGGIKTERVLKKAIEKGIVSEKAGAQMNTKEICELIFAPGFSTAEKITDVSGRGVGMDVVRTNIEKLGGNIDIDTALGAGTTITLRLPLTLAIVPSLIVSTAGQRFAVPQVNLIELVRVKGGEIKQRINTVNGAPVLKLRNQLLPLIRLSDQLNLQRYYQQANEDEPKPDRRARIADRRSPEIMSTEKQDKSEDLQRRDSDRRQSFDSDINVLVLQLGAHRYGLIVDELQDPEEIVVKPMSYAIKDNKLFAGSTILGDGKVVMILDVAGISDAAELEFGDSEKQAMEQLELELLQAEMASRTRSLLLFNCAIDEIFAIDQSKALRLEEIDAAQIETVGGQEFIQYRGKALNVIRLENFLPVKAIEAEEMKLHLLIPKGVSGDPKEPEAGILVHNIIDAVDVEADVQASSIKGPGVEGTIIVDKNMVIYLDPEKVIQAHLDAGGK